MLLLLWGHVVDLDAGWSFRLIFAVIILQIKALLDCGYFLFLLTASNLTINMGQVADHEWRLVFDCTLAAASRHLIIRIVHFINILHSILQFQQLLHTPCWLWFSLQVLIYLEARESLVTRRCLENLHLWLLVLVLHFFPFLSYQILIVND